MIEEALKLKNLPLDIFHIKVPIHCYEYDKCHFMAEQNLEGEKSRWGEEAE